MAMRRPPDEALYHALPIAEEALANGGVEILRAGLIDDELFVTARHAFDTPATWGEVLAEITRKLAQIYALETDLSEAEALAEIEAAYAADLGATVVDEEPPKPARSRQVAAPKAAKPKAAAAKPKAVEAPARPARRTAARTKATGPRKPTQGPRGKR
jgi:hypothetical protein